MHCAHHCLFCTHPVVYLCEILDIPLLCEVLDIPLLCEVPNIIIPVAMPIYHTLPLPQISQLKIVDRTS